MFQEKYLVNGKVVRWLNILDRGFHAKHASHKEGGQGTLQPPTSKSDERFTGRTTVYAAFIAHDWSGNERAVNVAKRSALIKRGLVPGMNPIRLNAVWRGWAFRANFMYRSVLQVGIGTLLAFFSEFVRIIFHVIRVETAR